MVKLDLTTSVYQDYYQFSHHDKDKTPDLEWIEGLEQFDA
jgi:hypothetical protein